MGTAGQDSESSEREHWYDEFARVLDEQGAEAAEALATTAREADSQNPWPYLALSGLRLRAGDRTGAEAMLADASERCHGDAVAAVMAGARWLDLDQPERTLGLLDGAVSADAAMAREPYQVLTRVRALRDLDRPAEAAQLAGEVTEAWREQPELADDLAKLIAQRAWALLDAEQPQDAAALLPTAPETDDPETRAELQFALGVALAAAGRIHEASDPLAGAEDWPLSDEDKGLALLIRGQALLAQQRPADAVADLRRALDLGDEARQQETRLHLALALVQSNSRSDEPAILLAGAEDWPLNDEEKGFALLVRGQALLAQERVAEAEHDLHTAAGLVADAVRPEAQLSLALAVAKLGRGDEALDLMDAVPVDRVPAGGTPIFGSIAAIAVTNGSEPRRVLDTLSRLATTVPNWTETFDSHLGRGYALLGVQNWTAAEPELQAAEAVLATVTSTVGEGPVRMTRATLVMLRAMAVRNQGRNAEAMSLFQTATQIGGPEWPGRGQSQLGEASAILSEQGAAAADRAQALLEEAVKAARHCNGIPHTPSPAQPRSCSSAAGGR